MHDHEHTHTCTHSHPHEHEAGHEHEHPHEHGHAPDGGELSPAERAKAVLAYMVDHNEHHASELAELVDCLEGEARKHLLAAIGSFEVGNVQLRETLELLR